MSYIFESRKTVTFFTTPKELRDIADRMEREFEKSTEGNVVAESFIDQKERTSLIISGSRHFWEQNKKKRK